MTIKNELIKGDLIVSRERTFASWIVRTATRSPWSHVSIYEKDETFISAVPIKGVCRKTLSEVETYEVYRINNLSEEGSEKIVQFCIDRLGRPYDFTQIILLAFRIFTDQLKTATGDFRPDSYVCSELVAEAYASIGVYFGKIVDNVLPQTIVDSPLTVKVR